DQRHHRRDGGYREWSSDQPQSAVGRQEVSFFARYEPDDEALIVTETGRAGQPVRPVLGIRSARLDLGCRLPVVCKVEMGSPASRSHSIDSRTKKLDALSRRSPCASRGLNVTRKKRKISDMSK